MSRHFLLLLSCAIVSVSCRPQRTLITTPVPPKSPPNGIIADDFEDLFPGVKAEEEDLDDGLEPVISEFKVRSDIQFRYARTVVTSFVKNPSRKAKEATFHMILPDKAFISNFSMLMQDDQEYVARVEEKEQAKKAYDQAVSSGQSAGLVSQDVRNANKMVVTTNVEGHGKVRFVLTYEELLERKLSRYEHVIHVNPGSVIDKFGIDVYINESLPVSHVKVPALKTDPNAITSDTQNPYATIDCNSNDTSQCHIKYKPPTDYQKQSSKTGISGQLIIQYDVDRKEESSDIQVIDGYFVHFFAPDNLETLPKHVIFVLDVSGSMYGVKLQQTKDAMVTILDDMTGQDHFNILTFSDNVYHWKPKNQKYLEGPHQITYQGTSELRDEALEYSLALKTIGGTNINDGLVEAIRLAKQVQEEKLLPESTKPLIIFLTDGEATTGITSSDQILANMKEEIGASDIPIFGLAFGTGADFGLIKKISEKTNGLARKIFEGSDAAIQLEDFYLEVASPKLSNVKFDYVGELLKNNSLTGTKFGSFNQGNEIVVAGKFEELDSNDTDEIEITLTGNGAKETFEKKLTICLRPFIPDEPIALPTARQDNITDTQPIVRPYPHTCFPIPEPKPKEPTSESQNFIERLWAFMTINKLLAEQEDSKDLKPKLDIKKIADPLRPIDISVIRDIVPVPPKRPIDIMPLPPKKPDSPKEKALKLALKYNFVTPITSLVVVQPDDGNSTSNETKALPIELVPADTPSYTPHHGVRFRSKYSGAQSTARLGGGGGRFAMSAIPRMPVLYKKTNSAAGPPLGQVPQFGVARSGDYDEDYAPESFSHPQTTTTTTPKSSCSGELKLYSKTYLRGDERIISADTSDLDEFANKLTSLEVTGDCCWQIFAGVNFTGNDFVFRTGEYKSASQMKFLFRKAKSVKRLLSC